MVGSLKQSTVYNLCTVRGVANLKSASTEKSPEESTTNNKKLRMFDLQEIKTTVFL